MIVKDDVNIIKNILSLQNENVNVKVLDTATSAIKENNYLKMFEALLPCVDDIDVLKTEILKTLKAIRTKNDRDLLESILSISNENIDLTLLLNVYKVLEKNSSIKDNLFDSFSNNQIKAKRAIFDALKLLKVLNKESTVVIWGSWYGSILVPVLAPRVKKVIGVDIDEDVVNIANKKLFSEFKNVDFQCFDVFDKHKNYYKETNLIINTSCEHMKPMKEWKWFEKGSLVEDGVSEKEPKLSSNCWFVFQSNNMFGIEGHINCVNSLEEFESQLPERAKVYFRDEVEDTRGTRYMLVGKLMPL